VIAGNFPPNSQLSLRSISNLLFLLSDCQHTIDPLNTIPVAERVNIRTGGLKDFVHKNANLGGRYATACPDSNFLI